MKLSLRGLGLGLGLGLGVGASLAALTALAGCAAPAGEEDTSVAQDEALRRYEDAPRERTEVGLLHFGSSYCTATLIGARTVITAAHCFHFSSGVVAASAPAPGRFSIDRPDGSRVTFTYHRYRADASVLDVKFDLGIAQLDTPVGADLATPAKIAEQWPSERLTVYGYGRYGAGCSSQDASPQKRKTTVPPSFPFVKATTCPGDSGGPYFRGTSNEIVATVKGDGMGLEWSADAVGHRNWILQRLAESEKGALTVD